MNAYPLGMSFIFSTILNVACSRISLTSLSVASPHLLLPFNQSNSIACLILRGISTPNLYFFPFLILCRANSRDRRINSVGSFEYFLHHFQPGVLIIFLSWAYFASEIGSVSLIDLKVSHVLSSFSQIINTFHFPFSNL